MSSRIFLLSFLTMIAFFTNAQVYQKVYTPYEYERFRANRFRPAIDTVADAEEGSLAVKSGKLWLKDGSWKLISGETSGLQQVINADANLSGKNNTILLGDSSFSFLTDVTGLASGHVTISGASDYLIRLFGTGGTAPAIKFMDGAYPDDVTRIGYVDGTNEFYIENVTSGFDPVTNYLSLGNQVSALTYFNSVSGTKQFRWGSDVAGFRFQDGVNQVGLSYYNDYYTNGISISGDRHIPDVGGVKRVISDSLATMKNLATGSLTATGDYSHNWAQKDLNIDSVKNFGIASRQPAGPNWHLGGFSANNENASIVSALYNPVTGVASHTRSILTGYDFASSFSGVSLLEKDESDEIYFRLTLADSSRVYTNKSLLVQGRAWLKESIPDDDSTDRAATTAFVKRMIGNSGGGSETFQQVLNNGNEITGQDNEVLLSNKRFNFRYGTTLSKYSLDIGAGTNMLTLRSNNCYL